MIFTALLGNPNVGKTTLFNSLTGLKQQTGNWAGVTVDIKEGFLNKEVKIYDLPGIYAMDTFSNEEKVSKSFLLNEKIDVIINIVDASNLNRNLYLTTQLKHFKIPIILVLNMIDIAKNKGIVIDTDALSKELDVKVISICADNGENINELTEFLNIGDFNKYLDSSPISFEDEKSTYKYIDKIMTKSTKHIKENNCSFTDRLDKVFLNKFLAYPIFFFLLSLVFEFTFSWVGTPLADLLDGFLNDYIAPFISNILSSSSPWLQSLIVHGIIGGVGSVIVFLPVILTLFLGISFLEDSGYMARAAFIMDRTMRRVGLSGKAFIPLIMGFGCSVPAVMSARTLESEKDRKLTALLIPLMSCNARLPVYALFVSVFFKNNGSLVVFSLYALGVLLAFILGILFKNTLFKKDEEPFIIELPEYNFPGFKNLSLHTFEKGKDFIKKAGTLIFSVSVFVWILSNFNLTGYIGSENINTSFLSSIGKFISPIFSPLGFGNWQSSVALLTGLLAKEVVIGTMGAMYGSGLQAILPTLFTGLSAYAFLIFVLLYTPCVSVIATLKKEFGNKLAAFSVLYQLSLAWFFSFLVYNIGHIFLK